MWLFLRLFLENKWALENTMMIPSKLAMLMRARNVYDMRKEKYDNEY